MGGWDFAAEVMGPQEMEAQGEKERDKKEFDVGKHKWLKGVLSIPEMDIFFFSSHFVVIVQ